MVSLFSLWLPILLSAVLVFIVSSIIHMLVGYHNLDYKKLPDENKFLDEMGKLKTPPGDYMFPCTYDTKERKSKEFQDKYNRGPAGIITLFPPGSVNMASSLAQWFIYLIIVGIFAAYIAGRALEPGAHYLQVFRFAGATAFAGYSLGLMQQSIWYKKSWGSTIRSMFDGLIYALLTAGIFGWLWPV